MFGDGTDEIPDSHHCAHAIYTARSRHHRSRRSSEVMPVRPVRLSVAALLGACLTTVALAAGPTLTLRGDVATTRGLVQDLATAWARSGGGKVEVQPFNTASGLDALRSGSADIAGSARAGNGSAQESGLVFTPVAWDGLVMITHPSNPVSNLTLKQLHDIYYGKITSWNDVGGRSAPMNVYEIGRAHV